MSVSDVNARDDLTLVARARDAELAFLQLGDPSLGQALTRLADGGVPRILLVGVTLGGPMGPAHSWLRRVAAHWWRNRTGAVPAIDVATRLITTASPEAFDVAVGETKPIGGAEPGMTSDAWQDVPAYRHQVMVCRGPRCLAKGADESLRSLIITMMEHDLGDDDALLVHTGCQFPCNRAPVVSVQPDDVWYGGVDPTAAREIVEQHLLGGVPAEAHRLSRARLVTGD